MRTIKITILMFTVLLLLTGCVSISTNRDYGIYRLPENPKEYEYFYDVEFGEMTVKYNGRLYAYYGQTSEEVPPKCIRECLGFVNHKESRRLYTLADDPDNNYLMIIGINSIRGDYAFYRAQDTLGKDISTPWFVTSLNFDCWNYSDNYEVKDNKAELRINVY